MPPTFANSTSPSSVTAMPRTWVEGTSSPSTIKSRTEDKLAALLVPAVNRVATWMASSSVSLYTTARSLLDTGSPTACTCRGCLVVEDESAEGSDPRVRL